jgi:molybdopterin molybdotransferase
MHPDTALELIAGIDIRLSSETASLEAALGRIPVETPFSRLDQPPFDKATMDGFAYASSSEVLAKEGDEFVLVGQAAAGSPSVAPLRPGQCLRIMTGAAAPEGALAVHRLERAAQSGECVRIIEGEIESNIVRRGANSRSGSALFPRRPLKCQDIGILAANGISRLEVVRRPRVAVLSSGDELVAAEEECAANRIYDSNGPLLVAQAEAFGCEVSFGGIVPDNERALCDAIRKAAADADLVILSGGVSAGDYDFVPRAAAEEGFSLLFHGLKLKPGKPALLARRGGHLLYGMPGNPVSSFLNFELLVKPILRRLAGLEYAPPRARVRVGSAFSRRESDRVEFVPAMIALGSASPIRYTGSTMLDALAAADAMVRFEIGEREIPEGVWVDALLV